MKNQKFTQQEIFSLCEQLALLLHAGVSISNGITLLSEQEEDASCRKALASIANELDDGVPLTQALENSGCFPTYMTGLIEVGEQTGRTEESLKALAEYYEGRMKLDRRIRSALMYPSILLVLMLIVIVVLLVKVMPIFNDVYASLGSSLGGVAGGLLSVGSALDTAMPILCVILAVVVVFIIGFACSESFREKLMEFWRSKAGDTGFSRKLNNARTAQALMMGMQSGLNMDESLKLAARLLEGVPAAVKRCQECSDLVSDGLDLPEALNKTDVLSPAICRLLSLGLKSGSGDTVMTEIARRLSEEADNDLEDKISRIEPALVLVTSILVGAILLSVMLPLMNIMATIG